MVSKAKVIAFIGYALVFATGCAVGATPKKKSIPPAPTPEPEPEVPPVPAERKRYGVSLGVDPNDEKLMTAVTAAAQAWNTALGGEWVTVKPDGDVPVFWIETVEGLGCVPAADIPEGKYQSGCAAATGTKDAHMVLAEKIPNEARLRGTVLHETGHLLRAGLGPSHIDQPESGFPYNEANVMNHTGNPETMITPSADDVAFIWQGMRYDYSQNTARANEEE